MSFLDCNYIPGQGLQVKIDKDELAEMMEQDQKEEARLENLEHEDNISQDENDNPAWDMNNGDYL